VLKRSDFESRIGLLVITFLYIHASLHFAFNVFHSFRYHNFRCLLCFVGDPETKLIWLMFTKSVKTGGEKKKVIPNIRVESVRQNLSSPNFSWNQIGRIRFKIQMQNHTWRRVDFPLPSLSMTNHHLSYINLEICATRTPVRHIFMATSQTMTRKCKEKKGVECNLVAQSDFSFSSWKKCQTDWNNFTESCEMLF
jgi:hypothetical protein